MTTKNKPAYPGSTAISIKEYFTLPIEERTKVLQSYIELHNGVSDDMQSKYTPKEVAEMLRRNQESNITIYTQLTEMSKLMGDMANIIANNVDKFEGTDIDQYGHTVHTMLEQVRMLTVGMVAEYEGDLDTQLSASEALIYTLGGE